MTEEYYAFRGKRKFIEHTVESYFNLMHDHPEIRNSPYVRVLDRYFSQLKHIMGGSHDENKDRIEVQKYRP